MTIYITPTPLRVETKSQSLDNDVTPLILPDGNTRCGYQGSALKVVELAEHCARLRSVRELTLLLLSSQNVACRSESALNSIASAVRQLLEMVQWQGALRRAGVRCSLIGSLANLEARGDAGVAIATGVRGLIDATCRVGVQPGVRLELRLAVDCDSHLIDNTGTNIILRSAAEHEDVFRPSGVALAGDVMCVASSASWPAFDVETLDAAVTSYWNPPASWTNYNIPYIVELLDALKLPSNTAPLHLCLPVCETSEELRASRLMLQALHRRSVVARLMDGSYLGGAWDNSVPIIVSLLSSISDANAPTPYDSMVLPNQCGQALWLPSELPRSTWFALHACDSTAMSTADAIVRAMMFSEKHPPLFGADRTISDQILAHPKPIKAN